jgi:hypothetical protein
MRLNYQEVALLQSYANLLLGSLPAEVRVAYDGATEELIVQCRRLSDPPNDVGVRHCGKVATLTEAQALIEAAIDALRSRTR